MELSSRTSSEKYNPITGTPIPVHAPRRNTSAIFGGSPGDIEYMFIPPSGTTRPTKPTTSFEKRRSISRESLRRPSSVSTEGQPDSDECSSISDVSECSSEADHRERTRTSSGSFPARTRKLATRSASSRLPVSASRPCVMKRAHSFTRGTGSCVPRVQANNSRGSTNNPREATSTSDLSTQTRMPSVGGTSKIPRKPSTGPRGAGPQSSRIPFKRADVNSNVAERETERTGNENTTNKRTVQADSKPTENTSSKQPSSVFKGPSKPEPTLSKQNSGSGIPVKGGKTHQPSGSSRIPSAKQDGPCVRNDVTTKKNTEQNQNIDKENDDNKNAMQGGKSTLKREGTGDDLRVAKNDVTKSKLPRKSNIPKSNVVKTSQQKTRNNPEVETKPAKTNQTAKTKANSLVDNKTNLPSQNSARRDLSTKPAEATTANTSNTLQRSDSGYGDTDSVSSKEDAPVVEPENEFSLSRENSKSKIPVMSWKSRAAAKPNQEAPSNDETKPKEDTKGKNDEAGEENAEYGDENVECGDETETGIRNDKNIKTLTKKVETNTVIASGTDDIWVYKNETITQKAQQHNIPDKKVESFSNTTKTEKNKIPSRENLVGGLVTSKNVVVTSQTESRGLPNKDVEQEIEPSKEIDSFNTHGGLSTRGSANNNGKASMLKSNNNGVIVQRAKHISSGGEKNMLRDAEEKQNGGENRKNLDIKMEYKVSAMNVSDEKQSTEKLIDFESETSSKPALQKETKTRNEVEKQSTESFENEQKTKKAGVKQSPRKPPRLLKLSVRDECEKKHESDARQEALQVLSSKEVNLNEEDPLLGDLVVQPGGRREFGGAGQPRDVGQPGEEGVEREEEPPRRSDNCMQCRMEQSMSDGEEMPTLEDDPGFRQYPTFISPRKSLIICKHHAKQKNDADVPRDDAEESRDDAKMSRDDTDMSRNYTEMSRDDTKMSREPIEKPLVAMTSLSAVNNEHKSSRENVHKLEYHPDLTSKNLGFSHSHQESDEVTSTGGVESPLGEKSRKISPKSSNAEKAPNTTKNNMKDSSDSLKTPKTSANSRQVETRNPPGPKGNHSPLLALSRDKKFASSTKPAEDIKNAFSLEWDDIGTELSPPNFSDDEEDFPGSGAKCTEGDIEDTRRPSVKLMNTNEALDKLKVIQSLIMKEAESRSRKESEESAGKCAAGRKKIETESMDENFTKTPGSEAENYGGKYGVPKYKDESTSNPVSPTLDSATRRKISSPTIWDRITDNSAISQDQTTELLNETLAKLKASPKLSSNAFARRTLSSRSLPGSKHASKEQLLSDGERPVYVYTSSWMNTSGKNSRGSSLSLCSANRSLPSSRQNLTKEPFNGLKRSESAAGRMEKENGKRLEPKVERKEFRLSDFDEINLSDDGITDFKLKTPKVSPLVDKSPGNDDEMARKPFKKSKRRKKSKNTAATMNNVSAYGVSMDDLDDGKTKCQCGGKGCVIS